MESGVEVYLSAMVGLLELVLGDLYTTIFAL